MWRLALSGGLYLLGLYLLWQTPYHLFQEPPLSLALLGIGLLLLSVLLGVGPPPLAWAWWGFGLLSLLWSLAPGHTLVAALWEVWPLLGLAAGRWRVGVLLLLAFLLLDGLYTALALWQAGLVVYISGSHHYLLGSIALGALPLFLARTARREGLLWPQGLLLVLALYGVLISGARAVYLPLLFLLPLALLLLRKEGLGRRALLLFLLALLWVGTLEALVPGNAILNALSLKAAQTRDEAQGATGEGIGNVEARLLMARLALRMAFQHPLGMGNGTYSQVFEAFMDYPGLPGVWSRSPHNYLLETLATGGVVRFGLLLLLLWPSVRALRGRDWPWALSALGLWAPMLFDVSGYYPSYLALAFLTLGAATPTLLPSPRPLGLGGVLAASLLALLWYWPCGGYHCAQRHLFFPSYTQEALRQGSPEEASALLEEARRRYPLSPWPLLLALEGLSNGEARLEIARELALRFPYARESFYILWAKAALGAGRREEAKEALELGLRHFPSSHGLRSLWEGLRDPRQTGPPKGP
ncbi:O-antigen ligase family protein [Thermus albus]|uniref:O-antigen ligase family protein n=1 Tax=Thermus albus TaxID=2908146 RepID=UPI001FA9E132|nr:O-antigen ligase family protein [Thermus albus]